MSYTIQINEEQRAIIEAALRLYEEDSNYNPHSDECEDPEISVLVELIAELPAIEAKHPGVIHGLCL